MLNDAIRLVRIYHGLGVSQVAEKVGFSKSYISELESSEKNVTLEVLRRYSDAFKIPISSLMLFAEQVAGGGSAEVVRFKVANKVVKMLDWIASISDTGA